MFCEKYYKKLLNYAKKDQIWADPNCPYRGSLWEGGPAGGQLVLRILEDQTDHQQEYPGLGAPGLR